MQRIQWLLLCLFLFLACAKPKPIEGYWYTYKADVPEYSPALVKITKDLYIDYFGFGDTLRYKRSGNTLTFETRDGKKMWDIKIEIHGNNLTTFDSETGSEILTLHRGVKYNFIFLNSYFTFSLSSRIWITTNPTSVPISRPPCLWSIC